MDPILEADWNRGTIFFTDPQSGQSCRAFEKIKETGLMKIGQGVAESKLCLTLGYPVGTEPAKINNASA